MTHQTFFISEIQREDGDRAELPNRPKPLQTLMDKKVKITLETQNHRANQSALMAAPERVILKQDEGVAPRIF